MAVEFVGILPFLDVSQCQTKANMEQSPAGNGKPRLVIKRLELENFKSYAGTQHVGPFHKVRRQFPKEDRQRQ